MLGKVLRGTKYAVCLLLWNQSKTGSLPDIKPCYNIYEYMEIIQEIGHLLLVSHSVPVGKSNHSAIIATELI